MKFIFLYRTLSTLISLPRRSDSLLLAQWGRFWQLYSWLSWMGILWSILEKLTQKTKQTQTSWSENSRVPHLKDGNNRTLWAMVTSRWDNVLRVRKGLAHGQGSVAATAFEGNVISLWVPGKFSDSYVLLLHRLLGMSELSLRDENTY